ncbi:MAG TPA: sialate O-acetylesterase [Dinghuibacter sp.]|uniref:sialate O-acetylesterase n=1 Tax=Dinghuibacter sp. TaxID=2024697 RepID=UPI002C860B2D|nr:sialate O-acetylesterase [Dinghuibacter sp.]HTJ11545.1 sialate O-acetylesterase [Dinghuibacter sp.]
MLRKLTLFLIFSPLAASVYAQVHLPQLVSDHMVLQRDTVVNVWGWARPSEKVSVTIAGHTYVARAGEDSLWMVRLRPLKAGGPYTMDIRASNHIVLQDILAGDVWFCSGQSNMVLPMERVKEKYPAEIAAADIPVIRNFFVPTAADVFDVHKDLPASQWVAASPSSVLGFGAATWFFARDLYERYHVPIGIINSSVGGTPIQAWVSSAGLRGTPYADRLARFADTAFRRSLGRPGGATRPRAYASPDAGLSEKWFSLDYTPVGWHPFWLPGYWADQGVKGLNGVVWFRREIDVPESMAGKPARLFVGRIVDADETYVNGTRVGNITYQYPPRRYDVPAGVLHAGKNLMVVRVTNSAGKGGFVPDKRYELTDGVTHVDIRGDWQYKVGQVFSADRFGGSPPPFSAQNEPAGLYNTMVAPAIRYTLKGFLWYQGEANTGRPLEYRQLLPSLIADWRGLWGQGPLPFLYVQLPNFMEVQYSPSESQWAELREMERLSLTVPNTGMAVTIDAGEWNDIHPLDKKDVGDRLALLARQLAYGEHDLVASGPLFASADVRGSTIVVRFSSVGGGLIARDGGLAAQGGTPLRQFAVAGTDRKFFWADARIVGDSVTVSSEYVPHPLYVRYAWADNPEGANLYNQEGLPASPFRTD